jgi:isopentenyl diphosphate isomerase/L-lactate dehydrogenase-like FMN-dependent dehydrogenase
MRVDHFTEEQHTSRRKLLLGAAGALAGSASLRSQNYPARDHSRVPAMEELSTVMEFEAIAFAKLSREAYTFTAYGSEGEFTLRRNRQAFDWVELIPKAIVDVSTIDTASEILGTPLPFPIMAAPTAGHSELHRDGEMATHQGLTAAANTPMIVSNNASFPMDKIAAAAKSPLWFQLYPRQDLNTTKSVLDDALAAGSKAVVMTVDQQASYYERPIHNRHLGPPRQGRGGSAAAPSNPYRVPENRLWYDWKYAASVRSMLKVPMVAKGILTAEDARLCIEHGFDAVYVSNHGGRSLDYDPSTLEVLPEIVDAVAGRVPVVFDSGVYTGTDILKALALGAKAVCIGRGVRWGLAAYGPPGVQRVLEILQAELVMAMAQTGKPNLAALDRSMVRTQFP